MIFTALLFGMGLLALLIGATTSVSNSIANQQAKNVEIELAKVKDALIGWSASRMPPVGGADARPGELPCPDNDALGSVGYGFEDGSCVAGAIGRVPWKTLGIPEPKDSSGETLWYVIAGPFRNFNMSSAPITSDTLGNITVYHGSTATTLTSQAIAVVFAPGASLGAQNRDPSATALCATTGSTIARNLCAENYLETAGGINNATPLANLPNPPLFIQAQPSSTFNDRLLVITNADLMPIVEQRVAREMKALLESYRATLGVYPWADFDNGDSDLGYNRSRFPCGVALPVIWGSVIVPLTPALPNWLTNGCGTNGWASVIYYAVGRIVLDPGDPCLTCTAGYDQLRVYDTSGTTYVWVNLVLLTPGAATGARTWVSGYFEDAENNDNDDDNYITPTSTAYNRDRIYTVP